VGVRVVILLALSDGAKDAKILLLRHEIAGFAPSAGASKVGLVGSGAVRRGLAGPA
jgi:hypothetical protein